MGKVLPRSRHHGTNGQNQVLARSLVGTKIGTASAPRRHRADTKHARLRENGIFTTVTPRAPQIIVFVEHSDGFEVRHVRAPGQIDVSLDQLYDRAARS